MKNKKKLTSLSLQRESIVNLNEHEMEQARGGSSYICGSLIATALSVYTGVELSWWFCEEPEPENNFEVSKRVLWIGDEGGCYISEIVVKP